MNTPACTTQASTYQHDIDRNHGFITTHLIDAIILRSWALDDDLAQTLETVLTTVTGVNQKLQGRFDVAALEMRSTSEEDYRWISLMKVGEALGLVPFVPDCAVHQKRLRQVWREMYERDMEIALSRCT